MTAFEYKVVPAPFEEAQAGGSGGAEQRYACALAEVMNALGAEGWEYQRAEVLPVDPTVDAASTAQVFCNVLIFRRRLKAVRRTTRDVSPSAPLLLKRQRVADDTPQPNVMLLSQPEGPADATSIEPAGGHAPDAPLATQPKTHIAAGTDETAQAKRKASSPTPLDRPDGKPIQATGTATPDRRHAQKNTPIPGDAKSDILSLKGFAVPALDLSAWAAPAPAAPRQTERQTETLSKGRSRTPSPAASPIGTAPRPEPGPALRSRAAQIRARESGLAKE
ncbi:DUF4177 domain-containing protein [Primorskyibacter marinus]|uniref:DUF4177 domain-containing protein n=1 Tax=Primorskyibacter marinus TaxID=1977320 RepID=UPI000E303841|nr:DUF4177 domain-containing protein [Primorskyibacter marinus]